MKKFLLALVAVVFISILNACNSNNPTNSNQIPISDTITVKGNLDRLHNGDTTYSLSLSGSLYSEDGAGYSYDLEFKPTVDSLWHYTFSLTLEDILHSSIYDDFFVSGKSGTFSFGVDGSPGIDNLNPLVIEESDGIRSQIELDFGQRDIFNRMTNFRAESSAEIFD